MKDDSIEEFQDSNKNDLAEELTKTDFIIIGKDLVKNYEIGDFIVKAVDGVSIHVKIGEFIVIKGPSGAGKTSLLNLIGGLDSPNSGVIYNQGVKISDMDQESLTLFRLMNSGFIFQNYNLISTLTAEENVMFPMNLSGMKFEEQRNRAVELLKKMRLGDRREHLPFQLSAGEQQRVAIARALSNDPPVILADEPTANLDKKSSQFIRDLFNELKNGEKTIIVVTHDDYLIALADKVILFDQGKIIEQERDLN
ncbi:MAG: ABC transporter ATP-binding protein [Promethearchaeota archaeon]|jgi:putative ABC transport system ATP-binding protein